LSAGMQHSQIEEQNLIDRYVRGTMPAAERAEFEEHFVDCVECQEQIEVAKSLRQAIRESSAGWGNEQVRQHERQASRWRWAAIAACAGLLLALGTSTVLLLQRERARSELASARLSSELAPVVFGLSLSRDAAEPRDITLPGDSRWMIFLAEIDATRYSRFRASVIGSHGNEIWRQDGLRPNSPDSISVAIPSSALYPGTYTLALSGEQPNGSLIPVARFPLRLAAGK
jgi:hypothetical protein